MVPPPPPSGEPSGRGCGEASLPDRRNTLPLLFVDPLLAPFPFDKPPSPTNCVPSAEITCSFEFSPSDPFVLFVFFELEGVLSVFVAVVSLWRELNSPEKNDRGAMLNVSISPRKNPLVISS
jgi:hypothetical protein